MILSYIRDLCNATIQHLRRIHMKKILTLTERLNGLQCIDFNDKILNTKRGINVVGTCAETNTFPLHDIDANKLLL